MLEWFKRRVASLVIGAFVILAAYAAWEADPQVVPVTTGCDSKAPAPNVTAESVAVTDATGDQQIDIVVPASGGTREGRSPVLSIQGDSALPPETPLAMATTQLRRDDGDVLLDQQITSVARVGRDGRTVTVFVCVSPRLKEVSGFGKYAGATSLDDPRARGANVPIEIHVTYPFTGRVLLWSLLAALAGLTWTWLIRHTDEQVTVLDERWTLTLGIQVASIIVAVPVVVSLVIDNHDWPGKLSSYVALAAAVGGAVIAAAPTFRALASRIDKPPAQRGIGPNDGNDQPG